MNNVHFNVVLVEIWRLESGGAGRDTKASFIVMLNILYILY